MKNNIIFRKAEIKDLKDILKLNFELFKKEHKKFDKSLNLEWTYKNGRKYFKDRVTKKDGFVEVVKNNDKTVGYLCGGISEFLPYRKRARYAELENMFIAKEFRGKNLGAKLTKDFINWCKKSKIDYISVRASSLNKPALGFYRILGFKDYDTILEMRLLKRKIK
ncbi:MAG: GNAT family N-acetyltransferase [Candidatus Pacebacteria bacterium]|nr:GNAT family N-acetyltransferase [Candidatus Paceibacterota bacterium]